jgi:hypothetical protein
VAKVIARPSCEMARRMCFAEVVQPKGVKLKKVAGRERSSFQACLDMDLRYLYSGEARSQSLSQVIAMSYENGPPFAKMKLKALKPDIMRGDSFKLVSAMTRDLICPVEGCTGRFAEQTEVNRHNTHSALVRPPIQVVEGANPSGVRSERAGSDGAGGRAQHRSPITDVVAINKKSTETTALSCRVPTCSRVFKTPGWLARHIKSNQAVPADAANSDLPPAQMVGAAEPELPPQLSPTPRGRRMAGVDSGDGRGPVLVVGPGLRPRTVTLCHSLVTMSTDILGARVVDDDPGHREMHKGVGFLSCYNSNKPVYASPGCHFGGVRGYILMTGLLALYLQRCMYGE